MRPYDPNMETVLRWASELGDPPELPESLLDVQIRAKLVNEIDYSLIQNTLLRTLTPSQKQQRIDTISQTGTSYLPSISDDKLRANIILRLWAGCLGAAKTIALTTRSGVNTPSMRHYIFSQKIDQLAREDPIYRAGVEAAPKFKHLRNETIDLTGVPMDSPVRNYHQ